MDSNGNHESWKQFLKMLNQHILPVYMHHEKTFDWTGIHGRLHICRALIFGEFMSRFYIEQKNVDLNIDSIRYAIAFHDSGREGNGPDLWEHQSADLCTNFLSETGTGIDADPAWVGSLITKSGRGDWTGEKRIVHDADVLEIMRPCCGHGGRPFFREKALRFLGPRDRTAPRDPDDDQIRNQLIEEAWFLIEGTENKKSIFMESENPMGKILDWIDSNKHQCPLLSKNLL